MISPRAQSQRASAVARPGLIVLIGVLAVAAVLAIVLMLPAPGLPATIRKLVPPGGSIHSQVESQTAAAVYCTTSESLTNVADFFRRRLKLGRGAIIGSGISVSSWSLFGNASSMVVMPYGKEGFAVVVRRRDELLAVTASRGPSETMTHVEVILERLHRPVKETLGLFSATNAALGQMPIEGRHDSSGRGPGLEAAIFSTPAEFADVARAYIANLAFPPGNVDSNRSSLRITPVGILSRPKRAGADSVTFLATAGTNASILVHCFRSTGSTQTHAVASHVYK